MPNTKISLVNKWKLTAKIRSAGNLLAKRQGEYVESLKKGELAKAVNTISKAWDSFYKETHGSKVAFAVRLDPTCPKHRDKTSKHSDGKPGYESHHMYNAVRNATTRAVSSGKGNTTIGVTAENGLLTRLYTEKIKRDPTYTPDLYANDLTATDRLKPKQITNVKGYCQAIYDAAVAHGDINPDQLAEEMAEIEAELSKATG
jgi:hypothetical protein